jgi:hypothetical protein
VALCVLELCVTLAPNESTCPIDIAKIVAETGSVEFQPMASIIIDGAERQAEAGERLIDALNGIGVPLPQVCYHPQLGPIQTCDTCIVEVNGDLVRACATVISPGMKVSTAAPEGPRRAEGGVRSHSE